MKKILMLALVGLMGFGQGGFCEKSYKPGLILKDLEGSNDSSDRYAKSDIYKGDFEVFGIIKKSDYLKSGFKVPSIPYLLGDTFREPVQGDERTEIKVGGSLKKGMLVEPKDSKKNKWWHDTSEPYIVKVRLKGGAIAFFECNLYKRGGDFFVKKEVNPQEVNPQDKGLLSKAYNKVKNFMANTFNPRHGETSFVKINECREGYYPLDSYEVNENKEARIFMEIAFIQATIKDKGDREKVTRMAINGINVSDGDLKKNPEYNEEGQKALQEFLDQWQAVYK